MKEQTIRGKKKKNKLFRTKSSLLGRLKKQREGGRMEKILNKGQEINQKKLKPQQCLS